MFAAWLGDSRLPRKRTIKTEPVENCSVDQLTQKVLTMFEQLGKEALDLHQLFEAGGNDPDERQKVLEIVELLVQEGLLAERGNDFYSLTDDGEAAAQQITSPGLAKLI